MLEEGASGVVLVPEGGRAVVALLGEPVVPVVGIAHRLAVSVGARLQEAVEGAVGVREQRLVSHLGGGGVAEGVVEEVVAEAVVGNGFDPVVLVGIAVGHASCSHRLHRVRVGIVGIGGRVPLCVGRFGDQPWVSFIGIGGGISSCVGHLGHKASVTIVLRRGLQGIGDLVENPLLVRLVCINSRNDLGVPPIGDIRHIQASVRLCLGKNSVALSGTVILKSEFLPILSGFVGNLNFVVDLHHAVADLQHLVVVVPGHQIEVPCFIGHRLKPEALVFPVVEVALNDSGSVCLGAVWHVQNLTRMPGTDVVSLAVLGFGRSGRSRVRWFKVPALIHMLPIDGPEGRIFTSGGSSTIIRHYLTVPAFGLYLIAAVRQRPNFEFLTIASIIDIDLDTQSIGGRAGPQIHHHSRCVMHGLKLKVSAAHVDCFPALLRAAVVPCLLDKRAA